MLKSISRQHHGFYFPWKINEGSNSEKRVSVDKNIRILKDKMIAHTDDNLGAWSDIKRKLKQKFSFLTDDDLKLTEGHETELISQIVAKVGNTHHNIKELLKVL